MSDGLNQIRAMRVAEIVSDFRNILAYIAAIRNNPMAAESNEEGFVMLRRCVAEGQALLNQPFNTQSGSRGDDEQDRTHLRRIIADAAYRRFKAQKIYLISTAAMRWVNSRQAILQGGHPSATHVPALQQISSTLRTELASITDQRVEQSLRSADSAQGKWLDEDPSLATLQRLASANGSSNGNGGRRNGHGR